MAFWDTVLASSRHVNDVPYGKRLLPRIVDEIASQNPDRICFSFPRSKVLADGFQDVTFRSFANAVNKTAHFIQREVGRSSMFETVMYMGHEEIPDFKVEFSIALVALAKTGHKVLCSSHTNSGAIHVDLIDRTDCTILLHNRGAPVSDILRLCRLEVLCMPDMEYLLDDSISCDHYPYNKSWEEAKNDPILIVHASGSTETPEPVDWTQSSLTGSDSHHLVAPLDGRPCYFNSVIDASRRAFSGLPIIHGSGTANGIGQSVLHGCVVVLGPPGLATADVFDEVLEHGDIDTANCLPITLEEVAQRSDVLVKLEKLHYITYIGGPLSKKAGDIISQHVPLYNLMASTGPNVLVQHMTDREDWQYLCINPVYSGIEMRSTGGGLHELVYVKDIQGAFNSHLRSKEFPSGDLFSKHPTKPHHWKHEGRVDDDMVFQNAGNYRTSPA